MKLVLSKSILVEKEHNKILFYAVGKQYLYFAMKIQQETLSTNSEKNKRLKNIKA